MEMRETKGFEPTKLRFGRKYKQKTVVLSTALQRKYIHRDILSDNMVRTNANGIPSSPSKAIWSILANNKESISG